MLVELYFGGMHCAMPICMHSKSLHMKYVSDVWFHAAEILPPPSLAYPISLNTNGLLVTFSTRR